MVHCYDRSLTSTHKAITRMYPSAAFLSSHVNNPISVKVGAWVSKINSIWRAQGVLGLSIRVCIDRRTSNAVLRSGLADAAVVRLALAQCHVKITRTYRAISPRFAINIEVKGVMHADVSLTEELCLRTSNLGTPKRNLRVPEALRRRDCRAMTTVAACRLYLHLAFHVLSMNQYTSTAFAMEGQSCPSD
jgi:hypothetical protein